MKEGAIRRLVITCELYVYGWTQCIWFGLYMLLYATCANLQEHLMDLVYALIMDIYMHSICGLIMDICTLFVVLDLVCDHCIVYLMFICIEICCYCATDVGFVHFCDIGI